MIIMLKIKHIILVLGLWLCCGSGAVAKSNDLVGALIECTPEVRSSILAFVEGIQNIDVNNPDYDKYQRLLDKVVDSARDCGNYDVVNAVNLLKYSLYLNANDNYGAYKLMERSIRCIEKEQNIWDNDLTRYILALSYTITNPDSFIEVYASDKPMRERNINLLRMFRAAVIFEDFAGKKVEVKDKVAKAIIELSSMLDKDKIEMLEHVMKMITQISKDLVYERLAYYIWESELESDDDVHELYMQQLDNKVLNYMGEKGYGCGFMYLGLRAEKGIGFPEKSPAIAYKAYGLCSELGYEYGIMRLASCLTFGKGCKSDKKKALKMLYPLKGKLGFKTYGAYTLGYLLDQGDVNVTEAMECYMWAVDKSLFPEENKKASERLKVLYKQNFE